MVKSVVNKKGPGRKLLWPVAGTTVACFQRERKIMENFNNGFQEPG
jgi:hypothetical protein